MRFRLALAALLFCSPAVAQIKTKAAIQGEINTNLPNNTTGVITPSVMRSLMTDVINSYFQGSAVNSQTGTSYTAQCNDMGALLTFSNSSPVAVTLPSAATTCFNNNWAASFKNNGTGTVTITPASGTINGSANVTLLNTQGLYIASDGTNWQTWGGYSTSSVGAATFKGNPTASTGAVQDFTIQGLSNLASPNTTLDLLPIYNHTTGTIQNVAPGAIASASFTYTAPSGGVPRTLSSKLGDIVNAADYGVVCDGSTVNTTAFAAAIAAFPITSAGGGTLYLPQGICIGTLVVNKNVQVHGMGYGNLSSGTPTGVCGTEIRSTGAADNVVTLSASGASLFDVCVSSSVSVGSRTGAGVLINGNGLGVVDRVMSYAHKYGFEVTNGGGVRVENSFAVGNLSHGVWQTGANNENTYSLTQSNGNGGDGYRIEGTGLGTRLTNITSASNTGYGVNVPGSATDVWLNTIELSVNVAGGINLNGVSDIQIVSCFCEGAAQLLTITGSTSVSVNGGFYQGGTYGVAVGGSSNVTISGVNFFNQTSAAMRHGVGSSQVSYTGNTTEGAAVGLLIDATSGTLSFVGNSLEGATTPVSGSANIAANSSFCANTPISTTTQGSGKCY